MSDQLQNIEALCRLCLSKGENKSVFDRDEANQKVKFISKIHECVSIEIIKDNQLPTVVCRDCENFINSWFTFKEKCDRAQQTLKKWIVNKQGGDSIKVSGEQDEFNNEVDDLSKKLNENNKKQFDDDMFLPLVTLEDVESTIGGSSSARDNLDCEQLFNNCNAVCNSATGNSGNNKENNNISVSESSKIDSVIHLSTDDNDRNTTDLTGKDNSSEIKTTSNETNLEINKTEEVVNKIDNNKINNLCNEKSNILDEKVTSTVTSSMSNKELVENQSACHAIKISSAVSLAKGFFEGSFEEMGSKSVDKQSPSLSNKEKEVIEAGDTSNIDTESNNTGQDKTSVDGKVCGKDASVNSTSSRENVIDSEIVPDSTMTSPKEQTSNILNMVSCIKTEPVDDQELSESTLGEIRVKTEPEELVEESDVTTQPMENEEIDMTSNKCTTCNYVFSSNNSLVRHLSSRKHRLAAPQGSLKIEMTRSDLNPPAPEILPDNSVRSTRQKNRSFHNFDTTFTDDSQEAYIDDNFFCRICNRTYCSASELKRHNRSMKHMRNLSIRAALKRKANKQFEHEQSLIHASTLPYGGPTRVPSRYQKDYICPMENCNFVSKEGASLLDHMMIHGIRSNSGDPEVEIVEQSLPSTPPAAQQSLQKIYCKCKQIFTNNSEYLNHLKVCRLMNKVPSLPSTTIYDSSGQSNKLVCRLCDLTFTSQEVYLSHLHIYHKGSALEQNVPKVKPLLQHSGKLWTQVFSKSGEILYNCIICNKKFKQHFSLNSHLRQHKQPPSRRDVCKICNKVFSNSKFFEKHVRGHFLPPNSRKLFCFKCYKTFDHRGEIIAHRATCNSMKMKIYTCNLCKHSFKDLIALKEHKVRAHLTTGELPVQAFATVQIKEESNPVPPSRANENKTCQICNKSFYNFQNMKRHCLAVHRGEDVSFLEYGPYGIKYDEPSTSANCQVAGVIESQIDQNKWNCEFCKKGFRSEKLLIYHIEHHCPYLQHIPAVNIPEKPVERPSNLKHRCIICQRFLPSMQNSPNTVCARCMAKFEETSLTQSDQQISHKSFLANQASKNIFQQVNAQRNLGGPEITETLGQQIPKGKFFQCPIGKKQFTTEAWMMKHYKNCDGSCPSYINCARCNLNFKSPSMYEKHVPKCEAGTIKRFDCSLCGKTYSKRDYVMKHKQYAHKRQMKKYRGTEILPEQFIDFGYSDWLEPTHMETISGRRRSLQESQDEYHQEDPDIQLVEDNDDDLPDQPQILNQEDEVPEAVEVTPDIGSVAAGNELEYPKEPIEDDLKTFPCDGCSRVFNSYKGLANHSVVHSRINTNILQYDCKFCQRGDLQQSQIYSHTYRCIKFLLSQEPVVSCKHCHRNFNTSQQTKEFSANVISHVFDCYDIPYYKNEDDGGINPKLLCYICCYAFSCPEKLKFHKAEHARKNPAKNFSKKAKRKFRQEMENSFVDSYLSSDPPPLPDFTAFDSQPPRKIFRDAKLYRCRVCNRPFFSVNKLRNHEKVHGIIQRNVYSDDPPNAKPELTITPTNPPNTS